LTGRRRDEEVAVSAPAELAAFVHREQPRLVRAVDLMLGDRAVAEEIAQEALVRACSQWERVQGLASPGGWVHRVAVNLATSQLRRRRLERRARARLARDDVDHGVDTVTNLAVREALATLPPRQRRILVLHHVLGWTAAEIGELEGASPEAVRQHLHRGRAAMRRHLDRDPVDLREEPTDVR
jgi:RNA polymerase sigma-70 factor (ECF subfamily)